MSRVLVVDDATTVRMYYREVLEEAGFAVDEAVNGFEALEKSIEQTYDLLIVDVNMPKMDGYSFLKHARKAPELQAVPAIMISTEAQDADRRRAYEAGANAYLVKPVKPDQLTRYAAVMGGEHASARAIP